MILGVTQPIRPICTMCSTNYSRPGQRNCKICHATYQRGWRAQAKEKMREMAEELERLKTPRRHARA